MCTVQPKQQRAEGERPVRPRLTIDPLWAVVLNVADRTRYAWFAGLGGLYLAGFSGQWRVTPDSAIHLGLARSIVEGNGFADATGREAMVNPGLAYTLATVGGSPGFAVQAVMLAFAAAVLLLTWRLVRLNVDRPTATVVVVLLACNRLFYEHAMGLLTELPFTAGLFLLLLGHERRLHRRAPPALAFTLIVGGLVVMITYRSVGLVFAGGYALNEIVSLVRRAERRRLAAARVTLVAALAAGALLLLPAVRLDVSLFWQSLGQATPAAWVANLLELLGESIFDAIFGQDLHPVIALPVSVAVLGTLFHLSRRRPLWVLLMGLSMLQWIAFQPSERYLLPFLPLLVLGVWRATLSLYGPRHTPRRDWACGLVLAALLVPNLVGVGRVITEQRQPNFFTHYVDGKYVPVQRLASWLREHTPPGSVIMTNPDMPSPLAYFSRRGVVHDPNEYAVQAPAVFAVTPIDKRRRVGLARLRWSLGEPLFTMPGLKDRTWRVLPVTRPVDRQEERPPHGSRPDR